MIEALKEALAVSPRNIPLRMSLADLYQAEGQYPEAIIEYKEVLNQQYGHINAQRGLAACYFHSGQYSTAIIIYEQLENSLSDTEQLNYVQCLVKENNLPKAAQLYQNLVILNPSMATPDMDARFRLPSQRFNEDEDEDEDELFLEKPSINFSDVGGMKKVKDEISLKIIAPLKHPEMYKAYGKKTGGGILLYGPPGCGKTFIAKATAGEIQSKFLVISLHDILDMWIGNSEKNLHEVFEIARENQPCVLFIDEVDALGASRSDLKQSAMRHTVNQFLAEMDGISSNNEGILILAATNAPWSVDSAFRRPGRFDRIIFVPPPDEESRAEILKGLLKDKPVDKPDFAKVAAATPEFSGADLQALVERAVDEKLEQSILSGELSPISTKDLLAVAKKMTASTREWFSSARNYALYSNESGQYSEILEYIKKRKL